MNEHDATELAYKNGLEAGKPKWIPVSERLPEKDTPVLGMAKRNLFAKFMPMVVEWVGNGWCCLVNDQYVECCCWMPLPEPPKGE